jgi:hypothetical protein
LFKIRVADLLELADEQADTVSNTASPTKYRINFSSSAATPEAERSHPDRQAAGFAIAGSTSILEGAAYRPRVTLSE